jgi:hypothetical protein
MSLSRKILGVLGAAALATALTVPAAHADDTLGPAADPPDLDINAGTLAFDPVDANRLESLHFTDLTLNGSPQMAGVRVPPFSVIDATGSAAGWHLDITMGDLVKPGAVNVGYTIPAADMSMTRPVVMDQEQPAAYNAVTRTNNPDITTSSVASFDSTNGNTIVSAAAVTETTGTFLVSLMPIRVVVPSDALAGHYDGSIQLDVISTP